VSPPIPGWALEGPEPIRARYSDEEGFVERDGVKTFYEVYGQGDPTLLLTPGWSWVHSRIWKAQIPYLARRWRVVCFDGRGNGRSDRPPDPAAYGLGEFRDDAIAVLDAVGAERVALVSASMGPMWGLLLAADDPRIESANFICPMYPVAEPWPEWTEVSFRERRDRYEGYAKYNVNYWRADYRGFIDFWVRVNVPERHSTRPIELGTEYALQTTPDVLAATLGPDTGARTMREVFAPLADVLPAVARGLDMPVRVIHGRLDAVTPHAWGALLAEHTGGELVTIERGGHFLPGRWPVEVNLAIADFVSEHSRPALRARAA
jgi:pimeloyl-ACP methyl ester carboxylesterase